jgi:serine/threonine protein kinase
MKVHDKEVVEEICKEFKTMQSMQFENICKVYGGCLINNNKSKEVWLVMEYVDGGDLHTFLKNNEGPLPNELQLSFFMQATKALAALHLAPSPILHRDIKSLNFLVQNKSKLLLTDFGLSKAKSLTNSSTFTVGTVRFAAPEIVATKKPHWSESADIYYVSLIFFSFSFFLFFIIFFIVYRHLQSRNGVLRDSDSRTPISRRVESQQYSQEN